MKKLNLTMSVAFLSMFLAQGVYAGPKANSASAKTSWVKSLFKPKPKGAPVSLNQALKEANPNGYKIDPNVKAHSNLDNAKIKLRAAERLHTNAMADREVAKWEAAGSRMMKNHGPEGDYRHQVNKAKLRVAEGQVEKTGKNLDQKEDDYNSARKEFEKVSTGQ